MGITLKNRIKSNNSEAKIRYYANPGKSVKWFFNNKTTAFAQLRKKPRPDIIYFFCGGNPKGSGPANNRKFTPKLLREIFTLSPKSKLVWILPPPPSKHQKYRLAKGTTNSSYPSSRGGYPGDYENRQQKAYAIIAAAQGTEYMDRIKFVDLYELPGFERKSNGWNGEDYGNPQSFKDGIHVQGEWREKAVNYILKKTNQG